MFKPVVISSLHGFKSHGKWQTKFADTLSSLEFPVFSFDYGYKLFSCLIPGFKKKLIKEFYNQYTELVNNKNYSIENKNPLHRPSIVAHSLGSLILCNSMLKYPDIKFDKIILCGSIVDENFDWDLLFKRNQVFFVRNEFSRNDKVVRWGWVLSDNKNTLSGWSGFKNQSSLFEQKSFHHFDHGTFFEGEHIKEYWIPFLLKKPPTFQVTDGKSINNLNEFTKIFNQTTKIDDECYGHEPNWKDFAIPDGRAEKWVSESNPDIYSFLFKNDVSKEVVGYLNAMPLTNQIFDKLIAGKIHDNEILPEDIVPYEESTKEINLYIMSIALKPEFQNKHLDLKEFGFEKLYNSLIEKLSNYYSSSGIKVKKIAAVGWTPKGRRLCKIMGMIETGVLEEKTLKPIFLLDLDTITIKSNNNIHKSILKLIKQYN